MLVMLVMLVDFGVSSLSLLGRFILDILVRTISEQFQIL